MQNDMLYDPFADLGTALRWLRDQRGLTQAQAAEKAGIGPPTSFQFGATATCRPECNRLFPERHVP